MKVRTLVICFLTWAYRIFMKWGGRKTIRRSKRDQNTCCYLWGFNPNSSEYDLDISLHPHGYSAPFTWRGSPQDHLVFLMWYPQFRWCNHHHLPIFTHIYPGIKHANRTSLRYRWFSQLETRKTRNLHFRRFPSQVWWHRPSGNHGAFDASVRVKTGSHGPSHRFVVVILGYIGYFLSIHPSLYLGLCSTCIVYPQQYLKLQLWLVTLDRVTEYWNPWFCQQLCRNTTLRDGYAPIPQSSPVTTPGRCCRSAS